MILSKPRKAAAEGSLGIIFSPLYFPLSSLGYQIITSWEAALNRGRGGYELVIKLILDIFVSHRKKMVLAITCIDCVILISQHEERSDHIAEQQSPIQNACAAMLGFSSTGKDTLPRFDFHIAHILSDKTHLHVPTLRASTHLCILCGDSASAEVRNKTNTLSIP